MDNQNITPIEENGLTLYPVLVGRLLLARLEKGNMKRQVKVCEEHGLDIREQIALIESQNDYAVDSYTPEATLYSRRNTRGKLQNADGTRVGYREVSTKSLKLIANDEIYMPGSKARGRDKFGFDVKDTSHIINASVEAYNRRCQVLGRCPIVELPPTQAELFLDERDQNAAQNIKKMANASNETLPQNPETQSMPCNSCADREVILTEGTILELLADLSLDEIPPSVMSVLSESAHSTILKKLYRNNNASGRV